jgi:hypothetical protein
VPILLQKYFEHFRRETLIQYRAQARNVDSKEHSPRFDCFKLQFHSICSGTFATKICHKRTHAPQQKPHAWLASPPAIRGTGRCGMSQSHSGLMFAARINIDGGHHLAKRQTAARCVS